MITGLPFLPAPHGRQRRFNVGDRVAVTYGGDGSVHVVEGWRADPHPVDMAHCSGNSVCYRLSGASTEAYDWQLTAAHGI